jgi:hypothetical protein
MPSPSDDAPLSGVPPDRIPLLAVLYDRFANALDPFAPERDQAEALFDQEVAGLYDALSRPKPDLHTFKKGVILRCRRHLRATDKPPTL